MRFLLFTCQQWLLFLQNLSPVDTSIIQKQVMLSNILATFEICQTPITPRNTAARPCYILYAFSHDYQHRYSLATTCQLVSLSLTSQEKTACTQTSCRDVYWGTAMNVDIGKQRHHFFEFSLNGAWSFHLGFSSSSHLKERKTCDGDLVEQSIKTFAGCERLYGTWLKCHSKYIYLAPGSKYHGLKTSMDYTQKTLKHQ